MSDREGTCAGGHGASVRSVRDQEPQEFDDSDMMFLQPTVRCHAHSATKMMKNGKI